MDDHHHCRNRITEQETDIDKAVRIYREMKSIDAGESYDKFLSTVGARSRRRRRRIVWSVAAAVSLLVMACGGWLYYSSAGNDLTPIARSDGSVTLSLSDGSEIRPAEGRAGEYLADYGDVMIRQTQSGGVEYIRKDGDATKNAPPLFSTFIVSRGNRSDILLEDGTRVWLNSDSRLRFPNAFDTEERRVYLEGEAYFEVSPDAQRPFTVETTQQTLRVLGTEFNVYAYPEEESVFTTLIEGSVAVRANGGGDEVVLRPGQQAQLSSGAAGYTLSDVDAAEIAAWRTGLFIFNDNTLETMFYKLSRWYDFEYVFEDSGTANLIVMGNIPVSYDFQEVLDLIRDSKIAQIEIKNRLVTIKPGL